MENSGPHKSWENAPQSDKKISTIRVELLGGHAHLGIWSRGGKAGTLIVNADDAGDMVDRLRGPETTVEVVR